MNINNNFIFCPSFVSGSLGSGEIAANIMLYYKVFQVSLQKQVLGNRFRSRKVKTQFPFAP
jgi:hypothetical protein